MVQSYSMPPSEATSPNPADDKTGQPPQYFLPTRHTQRSAQTSSLTEQDRQTVGASSRVTESLRQMHASLQDELERSEYANRTMKESAEAFQRLNESYMSLDVMLSSSRDLLGTLLRSQKSDTWYLTTTFYMLLVVGAWLVFRRLIYGPMWWLVWLPLRMIFGVGTKVGNAALQGRGVEQERADLPGSEAKAPVEGLPTDDLPTAQVGQETGAGDTESILDEVEKIVEAAREADELGAIPVEEPQRDPVQIVDDRPRDEL
jgi:protein transport protein SEC20